MRISLAVDGMATQRTKAELKVSTLLVTVSTLLVTGPSRCGCGAVLSNSSFPGTQAGQMLD